MAGTTNKVLSSVVRAVVGIGILATAVTVAVILVKTKPVPARSGELEGRTRVIVMSARPVHVQRQWSGYGTAEAMNKADVPARVTAAVRELPARILAGNRLEAGDLIVQLDDSDFLRQEEIAFQRIADADAQLGRLDIETKSWQRRVELAGEQVTLAQAEFDRVQGARERGGAKPLEVDHARRSLVTAIGDEVSTREALDEIPGRRASIEAQREVQRAQRRLARQNVDRCRITSPLDGILQEVDIEIGENLTTGQRVARVVDVSRIEVGLRLPASARRSVRLGDEVTLSSTGAESSRWAARVARIAPEDDPGSRTMTLYVEVDQASTEAVPLAPGQFVAGFVETAFRAPRWVVPRRALDGDRILIVRDGTIVRESIDVAFQLEGRLPVLEMPDEQWVVLQDALHEGDLVVVNGSRALPDGLAVVPIIDSEESRRARAKPAGPGEASDDDGREGTP